MPVTRFGGSEEERLVPMAKAQVELLSAMKTNRAISDVIMSEINTRFGTVDLGTKLNNPAAIHVSFSWG